ncbi:MAG TPA: EamA family transporter [Solirubrobacteraceae bacterium]|nr:EamA family transporter [Solirubrobacteraceae bacterium]
MQAGYVYVLTTVALTVYGQLIFKWRIDEAGAFPTGSSERVEYVVRLALNPWMVSVIIATLAASVTYGAALTRFDLSDAYPFMALSFVFVLLLSGWFFNESVTTLKVVGVVLIVAGIAIGSQN